ncbi:MAG: DUF1292 domain-containing protein [Clostridiales bacterium]|nr:DUF1292 domain-containing protein [Clostridiales bacterium]
MSEQTENIVVTLMDENDESFDAELLDSIMYDGHIYNFFIPVEEKDKEEPLVIILEYKEEGDDIILLPVENEVLLDEIWQAYEEEYIDEE